MPNPGSLFTCQGPKTYAVSWRVENQNWITHNMLLTPSKGACAHQHHHDEQQPAATKPPSNK
jgi:hypothetical protein